MSIETKLDDCQYCASCCIWQDALVEDEEIEKIAKRLGIEMEEFTRQQYQEGLLESIYYRILRHKPNGHCIFLETDGRKFACSIYDFRPQLCKEYPSNERELEWCKEHKPKISE